MIEPNTIHCMDCFDFLDLFDDQSVDALITDMPYSTLEYGWDSLVPLDIWWQKVGRVLKRTGACVTTGVQPFTSILVASNLKWFRYEWVWVKSRTTGFMNARAMPLKKHEHVLVFSPTRANSNQFTKERAAYYPQGVLPSGKTARGKSGHSGLYHARSPLGQEYVQSGANYPTSVLQFQSEAKPKHPTQKPVGLFEYLIRTYTLEGQTVVDPFCGSGTTGEAAIISGRNYILNDITPEYVALTVERLSHVQRPLVEVAP